MTEEIVNVFALTAPGYYARGLSVIPLWPREKKPIPKEWSVFHEKPVGPEQQSAWINGNPNANIGLVLGKQSGITMIDVDTDDPKVMAAIRACLPHSAWERKGKKGILLAFRFSGIPTFRIKNTSGESIVECLSSRTQCVLPPSIHPETQQPYVSNCDLLDCLDGLIELPSNIEDTLREAVKAAGVDLSHSGWTRITEFVSAGSRDTTMTEMAGLFAFAVVRGDRTLKEAIGLLEAYYNTYIEKVAGDQISCDKHIENMIKFLHRDVLDKGRILPKGWDEGYSKEDLDKMGITLGIEETEWVFEELRNYLQVVFETHGPNGRERGEAIEKVLKRISSSKQLSKIDEDRILTYIVEVSKLGVKLTTLRARIKELKSGTVAGNDHSEIARAVLADLCELAPVRSENGKLMKWSGSHWVEVDLNTVKSRISFSYGHLPSCRRASDISGIIQILTYIAEVGIRKSEVKGINFANGFLTQDLKLVNHHPDFGMTYTLPFRYMPELAGKFPMFQKFLDSAWGRDRDCSEKVHALQEAMAVTLFGLGSAFQRAVLLHGAPRSGKTQLLRLIEMLVPREARTSITPDTWHDKFLPSQLHNKILNVCGELSERRKIDGQAFKDIVDGSEKSAQHKFGAIFTFKPATMHWFASNHMPRTDDTSNGFIRRWLFLTFHYPVPESELQKDIGDLIASEEREAIVAWAVLGITRMIKTNVYTQPESHHMLVNEFANLNNSVRYFLKESGKITFLASMAEDPAKSDLTVTEASIYNAYWGYCASTGGLKAYTQQRFRAVMRELQAELNFKLRVTQAAHGSTEAIYQGIALKI